MSQGANLPEAAILRMNIEPYPDELGAKGGNCTNIVFTTDAMNAEGVAVGYSSVGSVYAQSDLHPNIRLWAYEGMQKTRNTREFVRHRCAIPLRGKGYSHVCADKSGDACSIESACPLTQVREPKHAHGICCLNHFNSPRCWRLIAAPPKARRIVCATLKAFFASESVFDLDLMRRRPQEQYAATKAADMDLQKPNIQ
ncbi:MAG: hypothetical protein ACOX8S_01390 [Christensenellales bacterium]